MNTVTGNAELRQEAHQAMSRRGFLGRAGATVLVAGAGGLGYRAYDNGVFETGDGGAYAAWREWDARGGPMAPVAAAVLAANPHNSQAWLFHVTDSRIDMYADRHRSTGTLDPFDREMYVGLGCALENLLLAAPANAYRATATVMPGSDRRHVARVDLAAGPRHRDPLYDAIPHRHTDRSRYTGRAVPASTLAEMSALADDLPGTRLVWMTSPADRDRVGRLMVEAARQITRDDAQSRDSFELFRSSWEDIQRFKDGLTLDVQGMPQLTTAIAKLLPGSSRSSGDEFWVKSTRETHTKTAAAYGLIAVTDSTDDRQRLTGGRLLERVHLWAAAHGLSLQHMNQMTERADRERQLGLDPVFGIAVQRLMPSSAWQPLVAFRIGYPSGDDGRRLSPRRPAGEVTT